MQPLTPIEDDEDSNKLDKLRNQGENLARRDTTKSKQLTKRTHVPVNSQLNTSS